MISVNHNQSAGLNRTAVRVSSTHTRKSPQPLNKADRHPLKERPDNTCPGALFSCFLVIKYFFVKFALKTGTVAP